MWAIQAEVLEKLGLGGIQPTEDEHDRAADATGGDDA